MLVLASPRTRSTADQLRADFKRKSLGRRANCPKHTARSRHVSCVHHIYCPVYVRDLVLFAFLLRIFMVTGVVSSSSQLACDERSGLSRSIVSIYSASAQTRGRSSSPKNSTWMVFGLQHTGQSSPYSCSSPAERSNGTMICSPQVGQVYEYSSVGRRFMPTF